MVVEHLNETIDMMNSDDYKERFKAEYYQVTIRFTKLQGMVNRWDSGKLDFTPTCPREMYDRQLNAMWDYIKVLEERAKLEGVEL